MAEKQLQLEEDGQAVLQDDFNLLGETAGLADDRVFAELFRMSPMVGSTVSRGILPYGHQSSGTTAFIAPNGASGSVLVSAFRALIGSRSLVADGALDNWRDIRSGLSVTDADTALAETVSLGANATGNPRWDAIYAVVEVDEDSTTVVRKVKSPTTGVVADANVSVTKSTNVTIAVAAGTAAASPVWPSIPSDGATTFYIILGYVRVPNGFGAGSTVLNTDIATVAPVLRLSSATGARTVEPADQAYTGGGSYLTTARVQAWGSSGTRPPAFIPSTLDGSRSLLITLDLTTGSASHASGTVVDSRDWRNRITKYVAATTGITNFVWNTSDGSGGPQNTAVEGYTNTNATNDIMIGVGSTFSYGTQNAMFLDGAQLEAMSDAATVSLRASGANGELVLTYTGAPNCIIFVWLEFTGRFDNV